MKTPSLLLIFALGTSLTFGSSPLEGSPLNVVGKDWQSFQYGPMGTEIHAAFSAVHSSRPMLLKITDMSSPGAAFRVLSNGHRILQTPIPMEDVKKGGTVNPLRSFNSNAWSHGMTVLPPGFHHIRVFMRYSPNEEGVGALQVEPAEICPYSSNRLLLLTNMVDWDNAGKLCEALGGRLANLHRPGVWSPARHARFLSKVFALVQACGVDNDMAWIRGSRMAGFPEEEEFPASVKAYSDVEGVTGSEWGNQQMGTLCQI